MAPTTLPISLSLLALFLLPSLSAAEPLHFTLSRRAGSRNDISYYLQAAERLRVKYGKTKSSSKSSKGRRTVAGISTVNQQADASYFASVDIGTPPKTFSVILDTGSSDLWVADSTCFSCSRRTPTFDSSQSSSFKPSPSSTQIEYGSGEVSGQIGTDTVSMGPFTVSQQTFVAVTDLSEGLLDGNVSGIMGLGFQPLASTQSPPFWQTLTSNKQFDNPEFSFFMTRFRNDPNVQEVEPGGTFTLGGINSSLFTGDIEFLDLPVKTPSFWLLPMSAVTVQGKQVSITTGNLAAIDTGTTLIGGPTNDVQAVWAAVPGSQPVPSMEGFFSFPCSTNVSVSLSFGGKAWPINVADMNLGALNARSSQCVGGIFDLDAGTNIGPGPGNPSWVVGATFLKNVYSVYRSNPPSVGFAQLSSAAGGSGATSSSPVSPSDIILTTTSSPNSTPSSTPSSNDPLSTSRPLPVTVTSTSTSGTPSGNSAATTGTSSGQNGTPSTRAAVKTLLLSIGAGVIAAWVL